MPTSSFWKQRSVLVTGGSGFIGSHLVDRLKVLGASVRIASRQTGDLKDASVAEQACRDMEIVIHAAANVGGIQYNIDHSASILRDNVLLNTQILEAARKANVERFLLVSSACVYPHDCAIPTKEDEGFRGEPEPTNLGYGWSKRLAEIQATLYAKEFGMKVGIVRPSNAYGPRDHFDAETSHVIPALIQKIFSGKPTLDVWGNGEQSRSFLYVSDLVEGILLAVEKHPVPDPINLGTEEEIKIKELVHLLIQLSRRTVQPHFDTTRAVGYPRRSYDTHKARERLGFAPKISLQEGLALTLDWYQKHRAAIAR